FARNRNAQAAYRVAGRTDEKLGFAAVAFKLPHMVDVNEPVAVYAKHGATDRLLDRRERKVNVKASPRCLDIRKTFGRLKRPYFLHAQKHERTFATRHDPPRGGNLVVRLRLRCPPETQAFDALRDALLGKRLEQVVDYAEIERFKRVLTKRRRQDEHRRRRLPGMSADELEALVVALASHQLDIDERDIDRHALSRPLQHPARAIT